MGPVVKVQLPPMPAPYMPPIRKTRTSTQRHKVMSALMGQKLLLVLMQVQNLHKLRTRKPHPHLIPIKSDSPLCPHVLFFFFFFRFFNFILEFS